MKYAIKQNRNIVGFLICLIPEFIKFLIVISIPNNRGKNEREFEISDKDVLKERVKKVIKIRNLFFSTFISIYII